MSQCKNLNGPKFGLFLFKQNNSFTSQLIWGLNVGFMKFIIAYSIIIF